MENEVKKALTKDGTARDLVDLFNDGTIKYQDVIDLFGVSRDLIKARLGSMGLRWNNSKKMMDGEATEDALNTPLLQLFERQRGRNQHSNSKKEIAYASNEVASAVEGQAKESNIKTKAITSKQKAGKKKVDTIKSKSITSQNEATSNLDSIDVLLLQNQEESEQRTYRGFYWDSEIIRFLDSIKHGNKSDLMNEIVKTVLKEKGAI